jgi:acetylornithine deacetylase/succinyl-diaminopimelate desuccinylase-like protein
MTRPMILVMPLPVNAHNANENLRLADLRAATKIVALTVADLLRAG